MTDQNPLSDLLTATDVAELAGVKRNTVHSYVTRGEMPEPTARVGHMPVWQRAVIEEWLEQRGTSKRVATVRAKLED